MASPKNDRNEVIDHQKYKNFLGKDSHFFTNRLYETGVEMERVKTSLRCLSCTEFTIFPLRVLNLQFVNIVKFWNDEVSTINPPRNHMD